QAKDTHVVFEGHTVEYASQTPPARITGGSVLLSGNAAVGIATPDKGTAVPVPAVNASTVAVFGCNSADLANQYSSTIFTGTKPETNTRAEDSGAAAYTDVMVRGGSTDDATTAAAKAMTSTTTQANTAPENQNHQYVQPQVCTTANGQTTCQ